MNVTDQLDAFEGYWRKFSQQLAQGKGVGDFSPEQADLVCVTIIARLPEYPQESLLVATERLRTFMPSHYFYPPHTMHFTLADVTCLAADAGFVNLRAESIGFLNVLESTLAEQPLLRLQTRGFGVFPTTVFAQLIDVDDRVSMLRAVVARTLLEQTGFRPSAVVTPGLAFSNMVRFTSPPPSRVVEEVSALRRSPAVSFAVEAFEVVTTDKILSDERTIIHARLELCK